MILRAIVIDDEPLAREGLRTRLGWIDDVVVIAEAATSTRAIDVCTHADADIVFLDVQLPGMDGFGVLEQVTRDLLPLIVFVTAYEQHALKAFRVGAFDYLLKPYDDETLRATVERARVFTTLVRADQQRPTDESDRGPEDTHPSARFTALERLSARDGSTTVFVDPADIDWVEADGDRVRLHTNGRVCSMRSTMRAMEDRLDPLRYVRVHRAAIVAVRRVRELQPYSRGEHLVVLTDGTKLPLSRRFRARVVEALSGKP